MSIYFGISSGPWSMMKGLVLQSAKVFFSKLESLSVEGRDGHD